MSKRSYKARRFMYGYGKKRKEKISYAQELYNNIVGRILGSRDVFHDKRVDRLLTCLERVNGRLYVSALEKLNSWRSSKDDTYLEITRVHMDNWFAQLVVLDLIISLKIIPSEEVKEIELPHFGSVIFIRNKKKVQLQFLDQNKNSIYALNCHIEKDSEDSVVELYENIKIKDPRKDGESKLFLEPLPRSKRK